MNFHSGMTDARHYREMPSCNVKASGKVILDPDPKSHQHENVITTRGSPITCA